MDTEMLQMASIASNFVVTVALLFVVYRQGRGLENSFPPVVIDYLRALAKQTPTPIDDFAVDTLEDLVEGEQGEQIAGVAGRTIAPRPTLPGNDKPGAVG